MKRIAILGAGIIGLTSAWYFARKGFNVTVFEASGLQGTASLASGGILSSLQPWQNTPELISLWDISLGAWGELLAALGQFGVRRYNHGALYLGEEAAQAQQWAEVQGLEGQWFNPRQLGQRYPQLARQEAFLLLDVQHIEVSDCLDALVKALRRQRVAFVHARADLLVDKGCVCGVQTSKQKYAFEQVLVCCGCWSGEVHCIKAEDPSQSMPVIPAHWMVPRRGQMVQYTGLALDAYPVVIGQEFYLISRSHRRLVVGSTVENCGFDASITEDAKAKLCCYAEHVMPCLDSRLIQKQWAGLRPGLMRDQPLLGAHPDIAGVFLNTGHFRNGIGLAMGSAQLLAALVAGKKAPLDPAPFACCR